MRGADGQTHHLFSYLSPEQRVRADHPLRAIRGMTDRVFAELSPRFDTMYSDLGRPSIPPAQLLRSLIQSLYTVRSERLLWRMSTTGSCIAGSWPTAWTNRSLGAPRDRDHEQKKELSQRRALSCPNDEFRTVGKEQRDPITALEPERGERHRARLTQSVERAPVQRDRHGGAESHAV